MGRHPEKWVAKLFQVGRERGHLEKVQARSKQAMWVPKIGSQSEKVGNPCVDVATYAVCGEMKRSNLQYFFCRSTRTRHTTCTACAPTSTSPWRTSSKHATRQTNIKFLFFFWPCFLGSGRSKKNTSHHSMKPKLLFLLLLLFEISC